MNPSLAARFHNCTCALSNNTVEVQRVEPSNLAVHLSLLQKAQQVFLVTFHLVSPFFQHLTDSTPYDLGNVSLLFLLFPFIIYVIDLFS